MNIIKLTSSVFIFLILLLIIDPCLAQENIRTAALDEVNNLRKTGCKCGEEYMPPVPPLVWNDHLETAASRHADDMFNNNHFSHTGSNRSSLDKRITKTGYRWSSIGENISYGYSTVRDAVKGWETSEGHCHNMMSAGFKEMGIAQKGSYWVMDLASPKK
jgi:uncharacterized protein YkwD